MILQKDMSLCSLLRPAAAALTPDTRIRWFFLLRIPDLNYTDFFSCWVFRAFHSPALISVILVLLLQ